MLGSSGSVVPLFKSQLLAGGPLTVTHPDIERFFMTVREAVQLILESSSYALQENTPRGQIMVLDMGEPVKIVDLARRMIRMSPAGGRRISALAVFLFLSGISGLHPRHFRGAIAPDPAAAHHSRDRAAGRRGRKGQ